jgi:hypothetical protein
MLAIACSVSASTSVNAEELYTKEGHSTVWSALEMLVGGGTYSGIPQFHLYNNSPLTIRMAYRPYDWHKWSYIDLEPGDVWHHYDFGNVIYELRLFVYYAPTDRWKLKDSGYWGYEAVGEAYRAGRGDYRFRTWRYLR